MPSQWFIRSSKFIADTIRQGKQAMATSIFPQMFREAAATGRDAYYGENSLIPVARETVRGVHVDPSKLDPDRVYLPPGVAEPVVGTPLLRLARCGTKLVHAGDVWRIEGDGSVTIIRGEQAFRLKAPLPMPVDGDDSKETTRGRLLGRLMSERIRIRAAFGDDPRNAMSSPEDDPLYRLLSDAYTYIDNHK